MANYDQNDRIVSGTQTILTASGADDTITLNGVFVQPGTTGVLDGGAGTDRLEIYAADLRNTIITGIEETVLVSTGQTLIDASQIRVLVQSLCHPRYTAIGRPSG